MSGPSPGKDLFEKYMTKSRSPDAAFNDRLLSLSPNSTFTKPREKVFCTEGNLDQCLAYLNQELAVLGFSSLYGSSNSPGGYSVVQLVNNLYELLQLQLKNNQVKDDLEARQHRSDCDNEFLVQCQTRLKSELDVSEREVAQLKAKQTDLLKTNKSLENAVKSHKEEIKKTKGNLQHMKKQFEHEIRKKEREMTKLKERLVQLLNDKTKERCLGMEILNSIQRADGKRGMWSKGNKHEEDMYRLVINNYEERQKELMEENNDLRELLQHTEDQLVNLLNKENEDVDSDSRDEGGSDDDCVSVSSLPGGHYQMPIELVREGIEKSIREKWALLKEKMESSRKEETKESVVVADDEKIRKLSSELDKYKYIVMQQEEHIQILQDSVGNDGKSEFLNDSLIVAEKDKLEEQKKLLKDERKTFDEERKRFTEAAIKLGRERERFDEERALFLKQQLLNSSLSPKSGTFNRSLSSSPEKSKGRIVGESDASRTPKFQTQTPVFSPAPRNEDANKSSAVRKSLSTPSTEELYRALTLKSSREHVTDEATPRRTWHSHSSRSSSQNSLNIDDQVDVINENHLAGRKSKRIDEHAYNVKKALLKQQNNLDTSVHNRKVP